MSEPIPESIPTSMDRRSQRPKKRVRTENLTPAGAQAATVSQLFANPDREIQIPDSSLVTKKPSRSAPEIVLNVQGSSAGAGSGEFHVYKASRRREYERLKQMDEAVVEEREDERFEREKREREARDAEKTRRNREKRMKKKRAGKGEGGQGDGGLEGKGGGKVKARVLARGVEHGDEEGRGGERGGEDEEGKVNAEEVGVVIHEDD